jgi:hypothetical protein
MCSKAVALAREECNKYDLTRKMCSKAVALAREQCNKYDLTAEPLFLIGQVQVVYY